MEKIKVLIVDDIAETRENINRLLKLEEDIQVVGEAANGEQAIKKVEQLLPDVVLMDVNMPIMDGISSTEKISLNYPNTAVIIISVQGEAEYLKKAMMAGAREYLVKPFTADELVDTIKRTNDLEKKRLGKIEGFNKLFGSKPKDTKPQVITIFGTKGGVGKTTLAVNTAAQLVKKTRKKVVLVDLDLQFGDVSIFLNVTPKKSIAELVQERGQLNIELVESYLIPHISGVKILPAPMRPEYSELVTPNNILEILTILRQHYDYVIIDTPPFFQDTNLSALDMSNQVLLIMTMDLPTVKNMKLSLELLDSLHHKGKTKLILNRASEDLGINANDVENALDFLIAHQIPSDGKLVVTSVNKGIPFVISNSNAKVSKAVDQITNMVINDTGYQKELQESRQRRRFFGKLFG
ncbi:MAG: pilus assembly protein CpaE [Clostridia bacterium]|jgi:pilus assembly protein CpaE|nr:pilus assembly protein CpaE [Clostridia bacterium]